jgi:hypothetical protein
VIPRSHQPNSIKREKDKSCIKIEIKVSLH